MSRHSLKSKKMIQALLKCERRYFSDRLDLYLDDKTPDIKDDYKVAFLVSSKTGGAVTRNRIKRWMREDFRRLQDENRIFGAFVVRFKGSADEVDHLQLSNELERLYESIAIGQKS